MAWPEQFIGIFDDNVCFILNQINILFCIFIVLILCTYSSPKHLSAGSQPVYDIVN